MSTIIVRVAEMIVKILDILTYPLSAKKDKVTYISYRENTLPKDMLSISQHLKIVNPNVEEICLPMKYKNTFMDRVKYVFEIIKQVYHVKTSEVVLLDGNNFVVSNLSKKNTKVIQLWHATGAIKKFGNDYKRKYSIKNYDYVITSSSESVDNMARAFGVHKSNVLPIGSALTDDLFNSDTMSNYKKEMIEKYPYIEGKKVVLYAPTFRGDAVYEKERLMIDLAGLAESIGEDYILLCKMHPIASNISIGEAVNLYNVSDEELNKIFSITDVLVSDFSSIIFDFTILEKPIILYTPDLKEYEAERGLYYNYEEFAPGIITYTEEELIVAIKDSDANLNKVIELKNRFFDYKDGKASYRIADFINKNL